MGDLEPEQIEVGHFENCENFGQSDQNETENNDATGTSDKFTSSVWKNLADISTTVKDVIMMLASVNLVRGNQIVWKTQEEKAISYLGNTYDEIFTQQKEVKKSSKKHETKNTAEKIKRENEKKTLEVSFDTIKHFFETKKAWNFETFPSEAKKSMEHLALFFVSAIQYCKKNKFQEENIYSLIHCILHFEMILDKTKINSSILTQFETEFNSFKTSVNFTPKKFILEYSKLTVFNKLDSIFDCNFGFSPMEHQKEILEHIVRNFSQGFMLKYKVLAGYGKTTCIVPICKILSQINPNSRIVFCCNIDSVRQEVAKLLFHTGFTFGIVAECTWDPSKEWFIYKHKCMKNLINNDDDLQVLITGPEYAQTMIKNLEKKNYEVLLFLDDFTVGADDIKSSNLKFNADIMSDPPKRIIYSSATFPIENKFRNITQIYKLKFPLGNSQISPITCDKIKIGCDLFTLSQIPVTPFSGATTLQELETIKENTLQNPFLKKFCSFSRLQEYDTRFTKRGFNNFDINNFSKKFNNLNANSISEFFVNSVLSMKEYPDLEEEDITRICRINNAKSESQITFNELLTNWTTMFHGMTLIATPDPDEFIKNFEGHLQSVRSRFNLTKEVDEFNRKMENYMKLIELKEKAEESAKKKKVVVGEDGKHSVQDNGDCTSIFKDIERPVFKFPSDLQINSKHHCDKICKNYNVPCEHENNHKEVFPEGDDQIGEKKKFKIIELNIDEDLILLLLSGIGIWSKKIKNQDYKNLVLRYASLNKLSYVIADETISYGTNYPFNRVIVTKEFADNHSIETIWQVISRAGRLGLVYKAEAFIPDEFLVRLKEYALTNVDSIFDEGKNISQTTSELFFKKKINEFGDCVKFNELLLKNMFSIKKSSFDNLEKDFKKKFNFETEKQIQVQIQVQEVKIQVKEIKKQDIWDDLLDEIKTETETEIEIKEVEEIQNTTNEIEIKKTLVKSEDFSSAMEIVGNNQKERNIERNIFGSNVQPISQPPPIEQKKNIWIPSYRK